MRVVPRSPAPRCRVARACRDRWAMRATSWLTTRSLTPRFRHSGLRWRLPLGGTLRIRIGCLRRRSTASRRIVRAGPRRMIPPSLGQAELRRSLRPMPLRTRRHRVRRTPLMSGGIPLRARSGRKSRDRWSAGDARRARSPLMQEVEAQPEVGAAGVAGSGDLSGQRDCPDRSSIVMP